MSVTFEKHLPITKNFGQKYHLLFVPPRDLDARFTFNMNSLGTCKGLDIFFLSTNSNYKFGSTDKN